MVVRAATEAGLPEAGRGEVLQKQGAKWSDSHRARADGRPLGGHRQKIVSQCREQARWAYNGVVFGVKKEIPVERGLEALAAWVRNESYL
jgi:hypothetical protein